MAFHRSKLRWSQCDAGFVLVCENEFGKLLIGRSFVDTFEIWRVHGKQALKIHLPGTIVVLLV